jgi:DNA-binding response OmpR family regulator
MRMLVIVGDHELGEAVSLAVELHFPGSEVVVAPTGQRGMALARTGGPEVVIVDLQLPDIPGIEVIERIRSSTSAAVIALTVAGEEEDAARALESGADDCMGKPVGPAELVARVGARLCDRERLPQEGLRSFGGLVLDTRGLLLTRRDQGIRLTRLEAGIMACLMGNGGRLTPMGDLVEAAWGRDFPGVSDSLRLHVRRLREKIEADPNNPRVFLDVPGEGYLLAETS